MTTAGDQVMDLHTLVRHTVVSHKQQSAPYARWMVGELSDQAVQGLVGSELFAVFVAQREAHRDQRLSAGSAMGPMSVTPTSLAMGHQGTVLADGTWREGMLKATDAGSTVILEDSQDVME